jgi:hypothetical protein
MFCHQVVSQSSIGAPGFGLSAFEAQAEMDKLRTSWKEQRPINWERVHRLPDHVRFLHDAHVSALARLQNVEPAATCANCHGDVKNMGQVTQVRLLNMGDCLSCHRQNNAPTECVVCHKRTKLSKTPARGRKVKGTAGRGREARPTQGIIRHPGFSSDGVIL